MVAHILSPVGGSVKLSVVSGQVSNAYTASFGMQVSLDVDTAPWDYGNIAMSLDVAPEEEQEEAGFLVGAAFPSSGGWITVFPR